MSLGGGGEWGPQVSKFEQFSCVGHQMSVTGGPVSDVQGTGAGTGAGEGAVHSGPKHRG